MQGLKGKLPVERVGLEAGEGPGREEEPQGEKLWRDHVKSPGGLT